MLGLSDQQQALYECLLSRAPMSSEEISDTADGHGWPLPVEPALRHLQDLGLVARIPADPPQWTAVPPETALDALILAQAQEVAAARRRVTELVTRFYQRRSGRDLADLVEVVYGQEVVVERCEQVQRDARGEVCATDGPPYATDLSAANAHPINQVEIDLLARGVDYRVLYDPRGLDRPGRLADLQAGITAGEQARVGEVPIRLLIRDRSLALLPLHRGRTDFASALVIEEPTLVAALQELYDMYWERAMPIRIWGGGPMATGPTPAERSLLPLLVGGLSDVAIARHLGWSERTVRRRVRAMMVTLNAGTRFQAGYQAVQRGWLDEGEVPAATG